MQIQIILFFKLFHLMNGENSGVEKSKMILFDKKKDGIKKRLLHLQAKSNSLKMTQKDNDGALFLTAWVSIAQHLPLMTQKNSTIHILPVRKQNHRLSS